MKVCDKCKDTVHDLETYRRPDQTQFDLCLNCELDYAKLREEVQGRHDNARNEEMEEKTSEFLTKGKEAKPKAKRKRKPRG